MGKNPHRLFLQYFMQNMSHLMKVRIDGRTFVQYRQFDSGVVVPGHVAQQSGLSHKSYQANDSMILNFS